MPHYDMLVTKYIIHTYFSQFYIHQMLYLISKDRHLLSPVTIIKYDVRVLHLRESTGTGCILISVSGTYPYLNLCPNKYINFSKNVVLRIVAVPYPHLDNTDYK
jgi:hypothetical protein